MIFTQMPRLKGNTTHHFTPRFLAFLLEKEVRLTYSLLLVGETNQSAHTPQICAPYADPLTLSFEIFILSQSHKVANPFSLNLSLFFLLSFLFFLLFHNHHPHFLSPFSQAFQEPPSLVFGEAK